jgi:hypothetical protein
MTDLIPRRTGPVTGHRAAPGRGCERPLASRPHGARRPRAGGHPAFRAPLRGSVMLATEADVLRTLASGTHTLGELYGLCEHRTAVARDGGHDLIRSHPGDRRWKRRVRGALESLRKSGRAERIARTAWAIQGTPRQPAWLLLIVTGATPRDFELRLQPPPNCWPSSTNPLTWCCATPRTACAAATATTATGTAARLNTNSSPPDRPPAAAPADAGGRPANPETGRHRPTAEAPRNKPSAVLR